MMNSEEGYASSPTMYNPRSAKTCIDVAYELAAHAVASCVAPGQRILAMRNRFLESQMACRLTLK